MQFAGLHVDVSISMLQSPYNNRTVLLPYVVCASGLRMVISLYSIIVKVMKEYRSLLLHIWFTSLVGPLVKQIRTSLDLCLLVPNRHCAINNHCLNYTSVFANTATFYHCQTSPGSELRSTTSLESVCSRHRKHNANTKWRVVLVAVHIYCHLVPLSLTWINFNPSMDK